ncbi:MULTISPECIES: triose-phosphate isomerase [Methylophilus]|jgi:triosephosphate isomerase|uniref:triose-phosphate isomerase n=1 Tax=Methylophilus TaxID=16 RepID=UPI0000E1C981|nr:MULTISPECIES: triose-phosphate isomerase [Methylophilus]PPD12826.1 MAG: triose-phosphate isomerase [Methylophilus sp.]
MRQKLVIGNWKLHGGLLENQGLLNRLKQELHDLPGVDAAVCLPYVYLFQAQTLLQDSHIAWGAQNVSQFTEGAFTSCISAKMVAEFGCTYTIIGHSERRALKLESNQVATKRLLNALHAGLTPIFCVGETQDERDGNMAELIVRNQMLNVVYGLDDEAFALAKKFNMVIAYEPVWAIGTGEHASPEQAQRMHAFIRMMIAERDREFADRIRIVYGGSMTPKNAHSLLSMPDIDGGLLGRAALVAEDFVEICRISSRCYMQKTAFREPSPVMPVI